MNLTLDEAGYKTFLAEFRQADKDNAAAKGETRVDFAHNGASASYFFKAPNFSLVAYSLNNGARINLTSYNHPENVPSTSLSEFTAALLAGGNGGKVVEVNLSRVIALTSEAARSAVVALNVIRALKNEAPFDNAGHKLLFRNYGATTDHFGFGGTGQGYQTIWQPLEKWHYCSYFAASHQGPANQQPSDVLAVIKL